MQNILCMPYEVDVVQAKDKFCKNCTIIEGIASSDFTGVYKLIDEFESIYVKAIRFNKMH